jgi:two-component system sensor histidine kinase RpfC
MVNRLLLAMIVLVVAAAYARMGGKAAQEFYIQGMPWLQAYLLAAAAFQAHLLARPVPSAWRRGLSICCDSAIISFGLYLGDGAAVYLIPLYFWVILGNGVRFGAATMGVAVVSAAAGFAATVAYTPFWRGNPALSLGLFLSIVIIPIYGALLLRRAAVARAEAERANHAKTLLLASVSHELRTPLTAIVGLGALLQKTRLDDEQREMVQTLSGAGAILMRQIDALLMISRDEIGKQMARERVDLLALLTSLRALLAVEADKKGVRLGLFVGAETPRHVLADPSLLHDILQNLAGNAVKFTAAGAVSIQVGVERRRHASLDLRVEVRDTGIGVDKEAQERIFESFVQADPDISRRFGGSGLGLAIVRRRLEACGGRIGVESEAGAGALFWFELTVGIDEIAAEPPRSVAVGDRPPRLADLDAMPEGPQIGEPFCVVAPESFDPLALARRFALAALAREGDPESLVRARNLAMQMKQLSTAGRAEPAAALPARKILLAEDNGVNRMVLNKILTGAGHATSLVADGEAALKAMLNESFDLILLDVNMPGISGIEAAKLYRFAHSAITRAPILALTADASPLCREQCAQAGMVGCLTKPIAPDALLAAVADAVWQVQRARDPEPAAEAKTPRADDGSADEGLLDPATLDILSALGGADFLRELALQFVNEGGQIVERMIIAVEQGDLAAFQHEAHALCSSAGNLGATRLAGLCRSWRDLGPQPFALYGDDYLDDLRSEWSFAALALARALASRCAGAPGKREAARRGDAAA